MREYFENKKVIIYSKYLLSFAVLVVLILFLKPEKKKDNLIWKNIPIVLICEDISYLEDNVRSVVLKWEKRGHKFLGVITQECDVEFAPGIIIIGLANQLDLDPGKEAKTYTRFVEETREIRSARILLFNTGESVLEHEIGHALGYNHSKTPGHIMYPSVSGIGSLDFGLNRTEPYRY